MRINGWFYWEIFIWYFFALLLILFNGLLYFVHSFITLLSFLFVVADLVSLLSLKVFACRVDISLSRHAIHLQFFRVVVNNFLFIFKRCLLASSEFVS